MCEPRVCLILLNLYDQPMIMIMQTGVNCLEFDVWFFPPVSVNVEGKQYLLGLYDTAGQVSEGQIILLLLTAKPVNLITII